VCAKYLKQLKADLSLHLPRLPSDVGLDLSAAISKVFPLNSQESGLQLKIRALIPPFLILRSEAVKEGPKLPSAIQF